MYFSRNSGFSCYSGQFAADGRIHYYERRLYLQLSALRIWKYVQYDFTENCLQPPEELWHEVHPQEETERK